MDNYSLLKPLDFVKGVGSQRANILKQELNVFNINDLLHLYPTRYLDRTKYYKINELNSSIKAEVQIIGKIINIKIVEQKKGKRLVATFTDGSSTLELTWFQGIKWIKEKLQLNVAYLAFGKVNFFNHSASMPHPELEFLSEHQTKKNTVLQAVYPSTEKLISKGITHKAISKMMYYALEEASCDLKDALPESLKKTLQLISKTEALFQIHFPSSSQHLALAQFRLKFEELFFIQLQLLSKNLQRKRQIKGHAFKEIGNYFNDFYNNHLPFPLTNAQKRVIREIRTDLAQSIQMNRLLQGDVGSGKTIVGFLCMLLALGNNFQATLVAPTEILATQHFIGISELAKEIGVKVALLTGSTKTKERAEIHEQLQNGTLQILIGTHAILEEKVKFQNLGLAIIDEQHRFGVDQRAKLWLKNQIPPHILVMTATPIPRTLAMSLYGDLDISVINELPPGRKPIETHHFFESKRMQLWHFMKQEIDKGRQVYVVYPLIQESETLDYKNLMDGFQNISIGFPEPKYSVSIVHGQMSSQEKDNQMQRFIKGETQIMVATTVIEVGVNVPNASVMIIESAERFGLSQLHQLRGRVGRGAEQSYCILMTGNKLSNDTKIRMKTMCQTNDGFQLSEVDLKLRGPGNLTGTQQSGVLNLRIADLVKDQELLKLAREKAIEILQKDNQLELPEHKQLAQALASLQKKSNLYTYIS